MVSDTTFAAPDEQNVDDEDDDELDDIEHALAPLDTDTEDAFGVDEAAPTIVYTPINWSVAPARRDALRSAKLSLVHVVSASLVKAGRLNVPGDATRETIIAHADKCIEHNAAEFVLKTAAYARLTLNVRGVANFLLAFAAYRPACRPYLAKYFGRTIMLPSDILETCDLYATFAGRDVRQRTNLPVCLRKAIVARFPDFDEYQLAKHNKAGKSARRRRKQIAATNSKRKTRLRKPPPKGKQARPQRAAKEVDPGAMTLKRLVRAVHLSRPAHLVMAIVGKRYPSTHDEFSRSSLLGAWDESRAGKRMKLKVPETWETQIALHGNTATVWQQLIGAFARRPMKFHMCIFFLQTITNCRMLPCCATCAT